MLIENEDQFNLKPTQKNADHQFYADSKLMIIRTLWNLILIQMIRLKKYRCTLLKKTINFMVKVFPLSMSANAQTRVYYSRHELHCADSVSSFIRTRSWSCAVLTNWKEELWKIAIGNSLLCWYSYAYKYKTWFLNQVCELIEQITIVQ